MADLLLDAQHHAQNARACGQDHRDDQTLTDARRYSLATTRSRTLLNS